MKFDTFYTASLSLDGTGRSWTMPLEMPGDPSSRELGPRSTPRCLLVTEDRLAGMGCCRPRLLRLGPSLLLSGGRCTPTMPAENHLWVNKAGDLR